MRLRFAALSLSLTGLAALSGAAQAEPAADDPRLGAQIDRICTGRAITGFSDTTETSVVVRHGRDDYYLIETAGRCLALEHARSLGLNQDSLCLAAGDALAPSDRTPAPSAHMSGRSSMDARDLRRPSPVGPCQIEAIYEWTPEGRLAEDAQPAE